MKKTNGNENIEDLKAFLGEGTEFKGVLSFTGTVRIDGKLEGEVVSNDILIVGESAILDADISVGTLVAKGYIKGNISAAKKIEIRSDSKIIGNIKTSVLIIEEGAIFEGQCEMMSKNGKETVSFDSVKSEEDMAFEEAAISV